MKALFCKTLLSSLMLFNTLMPSDSIIKKTAENCYNSPYTYVAGVSFLAGVLITKFFSRSNQNAIKNLKNELLGVKTENEELRFKYNKARTFSYAFFQSLAKKKIKLEFNNKYGAELLESLSLNLFFKAEKFDQNNIIFQETKDNSDNVQGFFEQGLGILGGQNENNIQFKKVAFMSLWQQDIQNYVKKEIIKDNEKDNNIDNNEKLQNENSKPINVNVSQTMDNNILKTQILNNDTKNNNGIQNNNLPQSPINTGNNITKNTSLFYPEIEKNDTFVEKDNDNAVKMRTAVSKLLDIMKEDPNFFEINTNNKVYISTLIKLAGYGSYYAIMPVKKGFLAVMTSFIVNESKQTFFLQKLDPIDNGNSTIIIDDNQLKKYMAFFLFSCWNTKIPVPENLKLSLKKLILDFGFNKYLSIAYDKNLKADRILFCFNERDDAAVEFKKLAKDGCLVFKNYAKSNNPTIINNQGKFKD